MDEAGADMGILGGRQVQHVVHHAVAHIGARRVGDMARDAVVAHVLDHGLDGQGGEVGGRSVGLEGLIHGLLPGVVGDTGLRQIDADALDGHAGPAAGLTDVEHHVRVVGLDAGLHRRAALGKHGGDLQLDDLRPRDGVRQELHRLVSGVHTLAAKGIKACYQNFHVTSSFHFFGSLLSNRL